MLRAHWCQHGATARYPCILNFLRRVLGCVDVLLLAPEPSLVEWVLARRDSVALKSLLATTDLMLILVLEPLNLVHLLRPLGDDLTLLADAHLIQVGRTEAKLLVKVRGEEACGTHVISCLLMVPVYLMVLVFNRHLSHVIFLFEVFHLSAPPNLS